MEAVEAAHAALNASAAPALSARPSSAAAGVGSGGQQQQTPSGLQHTLTVHSSRTGSSAPRMSFGERVVSTGHGGGAGSSSDALRLSIRHQSVAVSTLGTIPSVHAPAVGVMDTPPTVSHALFADTPLTSHRSARS